MYIYMCVCVCVCLDIFNMSMIWTLNYVAGLPVRRKVKLQVETSGQARKGTVGDVESGLGSSLERKPRGGLLNYFKVPKGIGHNWDLFFWFQG
jgi:hypothetical protein